MKFYVQIFYPLLCCAFFSCANPVDTSDYIITERDLIPEGTAFDTRTATIYIGSTYKRKIIQITSDGMISDFVPSMMDGMWSAVGMEVDEARNLLWVATAHANEVMPLIEPDSSNDWMTNVSAFNITTSKRVKTYPLQAEQAFLNDLTVLPNGIVFITETAGNKIYRISPETDSLELFLAPEGYRFLNGITWSETFQALYVSSRQGIIKIDPNSRNYDLVESGGEIDSRGIDGLSVYQDDLIGHQSSRVSKFLLDGTGSAITDIVVLDSGDEFDSSTTGEVGSGYYYFIVNSQIRSGIDTITGSIKPPGQLNEVIIRKLKL
jgi:sugar lactone lactonase YvrE